jgi:hypothetical protein
MLALYARNAQDVRLYRPPTPEQKAARALKNRRDEIQAMVIAETNRIEHVEHAFVRANLDPDSPFWVLPLALDLGRPLGITNPGEISPLLKSA